VSLFERDSFVARLRAARNTAAGGGCEVFAAADTALLVSYRRVAPRPRRRTLLKTRVTGYHDSPAF
jgi:hypothetical protein